MKEDKLEDISGKQIFLVILISSFTTFLLVFAFIFIFSKRSKNVLEKTHFVEVVQSENIIVGSVPIFNPYEHGTNSISIEGKTYD